MSLAHEIGLKRPLAHRGQETLLNIIVTSSMLVNEAQSFLGPRGLTDSQLNVLMMLKFQSDDGRLNQTRLGRMLFIKRSGLTGLIDRMETAGLVRRVPDPSDRRVNLVEMTDEGRALLERVEADYFARIDDIANTLTPEEQTALSGLLERIRSSLAGTP